MWAPKRGSRRGCGGSSPGGRRSSSRIGPPRSGAPGGSSWSTAAGWGGRARTTGGSPRVAHTPASTGTGSSRRRRGRAVVLTVRDELGDKVTSLDQGRRRREQLLSSVWGYDYDPARTWSTSTSATCAASWASSD